MGTDSFKIYYRATRQLFQVYLLGLILFMSFRTALLFSFGSYSDLSAYKLDMLKAYWVGYRFDTTVLTYGLVLPFSLNLLVLAIPRYYDAIRRFAYWYIIFAYFVFLSVLFVDFFYFKFFQSHLNVLLFGIVNDDTKAVMTSVWTDYPVIKVLLIITSVMWLLTYLVSNIMSREYNVGAKGLVFKAAFVISLLGVYGLAMRGSIGVFPLQNDDTTISPNNFVNTMTINGVFSLKVAFKEKERYKIDTDIPKMLGQYGFKTPQEALSIYLNKPVTEDKEFQKLLLAKTQSNPFLKENPPHVIFLQMESMSNYYLDLHSKEMNLLGTLEKELPNLILLRNFLSCTNGTIHTLEGIMINSPRTPISQSPYMNRSLSSSSALPFLNAGYQTTYITGGKLGWRNLDKFVGRQYFQAVEGSATLLAEVKNAKAWEWGVHDEFLFERIFNKLEKSSGKPQFIYAMTISNHTPFAVPDTYKPYKISITEDIRKRLRTNEDIAIKNFTGYQYANDTLGRLIQRIRTSPYGNNTIVVATGDHNTLQLFDFTDSQLLQKLSVPLVMYVPEKYRPKQPIDATVFSSHKDIFPTIFNLALSDATYLKSGNNLFDAASTDSFAVNNYNVAMNKEGAVLIQGNNLYYKWKNDDGASLEPTNLKDTPGLETLLKKAKAYTASMNYYVQSELSK